MEVRRFLLEHGADEDLIEAVDLALEDNEQWAIEDVEDAIQSGLIKPAVHDAIVLKGVA